MRRVGGTNRHLCVNGESSVGGADTMRRHVLPSSAAHLSEPKPPVPAEIHGSIAIAARDRIGQFSNSLSPVSDPHVVYVGSRRSVHSRKQFTRGSASGSRWTPETPGRIVWLRIRVADRQLIGESAHPVSFLCCSRPSFWSANTERGVFRTTDGVQYLGTRFFTKTKHGSD